MPWSQCAKLELSFLLKKSIYIWLDSIILINLQYQYYTVLNFMYIADRIGFSLLAPGHNDYAKLHVN